VFHVFETHENLTFFEPECSIFTLSIIHESPWLA
jgi:hypothetical protein